MKASGTGLLRFFPLLLLGWLMRPVSAKSSPLQMTSLYIYSEIRYRFASTLFSSVVTNGERERREAVFEVYLPNEAFVSNFTVDIDGKLYQAEVKRKEVARNNGKKSTSRFRPRGTNGFKFSTILLSGQTAVFNLTSVELLRRRLGIYKHVIFFSSSPPAEKLLVAISIKETGGITRLNVPLFSNSPTEEFAEETNGLLKILRPSSSTAEIYYELGESHLEDVSVRVVNSLVVQYDVSRDISAGLILVSKDHFVHFFAPQNLAAFPKNVIFILDASGSMTGTKEVQLKKAMYKILDDLREDDRFGIIMFNSEVMEWRKELVAASRNNIAEAKDYVKNMYPVSGTNINEGILRGIQYSQDSGDRDRNRTFVSLFLTDGQPSVGVKKKSRILRNIRRANGGVMSIFSLSFGEDADYNFLQQVSSQNHGRARRLFDAPDTVPQLKGFYDEISNAILTNVSFTYPAMGAGSAGLTKTKFSSYFNGSELVLAGKLHRQGNRSFPFGVTGQAVSGPLVFGERRDWTRMETVVKDNSPEVSSSVEKLWAYLKLQQLFERRLASSSRTKKSRITKKIEELSLKYNFMTSVTSLELKSQTQPDWGSSLGNIETSGYQDRRKEGVYYSKSTRRRHRTRKYGEGHGYGGGRGDPHFIVDIRGLTKPVCFDVMGKRGDIFQLLHEPELELTVNAEVIEGRDFYKETGKLKTYFGRIVLLLPGIRLVVTSAHISLNSYYLRWDEERAIHGPWLKFVTAGDGRTLTAILGRRTRLLVKKRLAGENPRKVDYLDFYIVDGRGLSKLATGLIGQFVHKRVRVSGERVNRKGEIKAQLTVQAPLGGRRTLVPTILGIRRDLVHSRVSCWVVRNNGLGLIDGRYDDYLLDTLLARQ